MVVGLSPFYSLWRSDTHARSAGRCPGSSLLLALRTGNIQALKSLDQQAKADQSAGPGAVVLEALLVLCHENKQEAYVRDICQLVNGILLGRHETLELSPKAVGTIMRKKLG